MLGMLKDTFFLFFNSFTLEGANVFAQLEMEAEYGGLRCENTQTPSLLS